MKQLVLFGWLIIMQSIAFAQHEVHNMPAKQQPVKTEVYICPIHPELQSDKPGKCPKCGMDLVKENLKAPSAKTVPEKELAMPVKKDTVPSTHHHDMMVSDKGGDQKEMDIKGMDMSAHQYGAGEELPFAGKVNMSPGKTVRYDLYVTDTMVNYTGKRKHAFAINGTLPGPDLVFTEGDTAAIYVHNLARHETSIHWHGVILPNEFDGVPYLTTQPIHTEETHLYKFAIHQNGTYWYHSHSGLQEQAGVYGTLIFKKRAGMDGVQKNNSRMNGMKMGE